MLWPVQTRVLLIACTDEKGLVARITGTLFEHGLNIVSNGEFVDPDHRRFFMRTEIDGPLDEDRLLARLREQLPARAEVRLAEARKKRIVVFATREPHCLGDLLIRSAFNDINGEILAVVSNRDVLGPLVTKFGHPFHFLPHQDRTREEHEREILDTIRPYAADYLVLAKYMRILTPGFIAPYRNRIINIHHSFLPAFIGANPYRQAYERGVKIIGATAHFVSESLDEGPIIAQHVNPIAHQDTPGDIADAGHDIEKIVLARALHLVFNDRVFVTGNKTVIFD